MRLLLLLLATILWSLPAANTAAQEIRGRVVDDASRQGLAGTDVTLHSGETLIDEAKTDASGFFRFRVAAPGTYRIAVVRAAFEPAGHDVRVGTGDVTIPALVLRPQIFELDSIAAEASRSRPPANVGFSRAAHVVSGDRLATLERHGGRVVTALREMSGVRVVEYNDRTGRPRVCVESRRRMTAFNEDPNTCHWLALVIDGVLLGSSGAEETLRGFHLQDFESVEYVTPAEAAQKYGMDASANGALVVWTRGLGPHVSPARNRR